MRLLLDEHVSDRGVGEPLRTRGHDVLSLNQHSMYAGLPDEDVVALANEERRIIVTHDAGHFAALARTLAQGHDRHAGMILITLPHEAFGAILRGLDELLRTSSAQDEWVNRVVFLGPSASRSAASNPPSATT